MSDFKLTSQEITWMLKHSAGDTALLFGLIALRCTERGGPGREMGVLSVHTDGWEAQIKVAAHTFNSKAFQFSGGSTFLHDSGTSLYSDDFLTYFSHKYAPIGADNDPNGLNANHARNLIYYYRKCSGALLRVTDS